MVGCVADAVFEHPRLAAIYDALDLDRGDLACTPPWSMNSRPFACSTSAAGQARSPYSSRAADSR